MDFNFGVTSIGTQCITIRYDVFTRAQKVCKVTQLSTARFKIL